MRNQICKHLFVGLFFLVILFNSGCSIAMPTPTEPTVQPDSVENIFTPEDYYAATPAKYLEHLAKVFVSLLPVRNGRGVYNEVFADTNEKTTYDILNESVSGYQMNASNVPVFYGLLQETETYLSAHNVNDDTLAASYGKAHAIKAEYVRGMLDLMLRKHVELSCASVAGAEYIEGADLFVYDRLEDPYQQYYEKGWTLEFWCSGYDDTSSWDAEATIWSAPNFCFWYDAETAQIYDMEGALIGYTHNIDGLRSGQASLKTCLFDRTYADSLLLTSCNVYYDAQIVIRKETPISSVFCGSVSMYVGDGSITPPDHILSQKNLAELGRDFFDNYYDTNCNREKLTNYLICSFYAAPEEIDLSTLPLKSEEELEEFCREYLGIEASQLSAGHSNMGTGSAKQFPPYLVLESGEVNGSIVTLRYYNEVLCMESILTLRQTENGYQVVSNLPRKP